MPVTDTEVREQQILDAAARLIIHHGYDKTTVGDIANEAGIGRGLVYLLFRSKDEIFEALIQRELFQYVQTWLDHIETDPRGGTIGSVYRAVLYAINHHPFMAAIMRRDRGVWGKYLRKPGNLFASLQAASVGSGLLQKLQEAGVVRNDVDPVVTSHIMDLLSYGFVTIGEFRQPEELPPYEVVLEALGDMMDRLLTPEGGGDPEAGKAIIRQLAASTQGHFAPTRQGTAEMPAEDGY